MLKWRQSIGAIALAALLSLSACVRDSIDQPFEPPKSDGLTGQVTRVSDGDTIAVQLGKKVEKVRLLGVDAPEIYHSPADPGQEPWGKNSHLFAEKLLANQTVRLVTDVEERDKYGRLLAYVYLEDGTFVNLELVRSGMALVLTIAPNVQYVAELQGAQKSAKEAGLGIWNPKKLLKTTPSEYRNHDKGNVPYNGTPKEGEVIGKVMGNKNSKIYRLPGDRDYGLVSEKNRVYFDSEEEAQKAGYRRAKEPPASSPRPAAKPGDAGME